MARLALIALVAVTALAACSRNEPGRKLITERCLSAGETTEVCECLARESDAKLDQPLFDLVVLGARGEAEEAELALQELDNQMKTKFATLVPQIRKGCGVVDPATGN
ncbi:MAG: hypothetical protein QM773_12970 [Hyphomonadaceae bacterium]